jgi:hypothetical protein
LIIALVVVVFIVERSGFVDKYIYLLSHKRALEGDFTESKDIGIFPTFNDAENTKNDYKKLVGFCDYPNGFIIDKIKVDYCEITDLSLSTCNDEELFYMVYHVYENIEEDYEDVTFIGCFSTQQNAEYVVQLLKDKNIFDSGDFGIYDAKFGRLSWLEGFVVP